MRVLFPFSSPRPGGAEIAARTLVTQLRERGHEVRWSAASAEVRRSMEDLPGRVDDGGFHLLGPPSGAARQIAWLGAVVGRGAAALRRQRIDLVHTNDVAAHRAWALASVRAGIAHVWHHHNVEFPSLPLPQLTARAAVWPTSAVIAVSDFARSGVPLGLQGRTSVVRNPVEPPRISLGSPPGGGHRVVFVGRLVKWKRPVMVVEVLAELRRRGRSVERGLVIGDGDPDVREGILRRARSLGVADRLDIVGWRDAPFSSLYSGDVVLCPSIDEPYGRVAVEAMLAGLPVVASDSGGHREIVDHEQTGLLAAPDDPREFADAVGQLLDRPRPTALLVERARAWADAHHRPEDHVDAVIDVYGSAMRRRGPGRWRAG